MIESRSADRSADLECGTVRMYAYFFSHHKRRSINWGTDVLLFAAQDAKQTCGAPIHMQEAPFTKVHWLVY
jgi:hypothetical protein